MRATQDCADCLTGVPAKAPVLLTRKRGALRGSPSGPGSPGVPGVPDEPEAPGEPGQPGDPGVPRAPLQPGITIDAPSVSLQRSGPSLLRSAVFAAVFAALSNTLRQGPKFKPGVIADPKYGEFGGVAPAPDDAAPPQLLKVTKTYSLAELQAIGGVQSGRLSMGAELPAGAIPVAAFMRNLGNAFTSSGGTVTGSSANLFIGAGSTDSLLGGNVIDSWHSANWKTQDPVTNSGSVGSTDRNVFSAWTPYVLFNVSGAGVTFANLTGGAAGVEITLIYMVSPVKKVTASFTRAQIAGLGFVASGQLVFGDQLPAGALPIAMMAKADEPATGATGTLRVALTRGDQSTVSIARFGIATAAAGGAGSGIAGLFSGVPGAGIYDYYVPWQPYVQFSVSSSVLSGITGGLDSGVEVTLYYLDLGDGYRLSKSISAAEITALGATTSGFISMGEELPAGSLPLFFFGRNNGAAGATITGLDVSVKKSGEVSGGVPGGNLLGANTTVVQDVVGAGSTTATDYYSAWTPNARLVAGGGNLNALTGLDDGVEANLIYVPGDG